MSLLIIKRIDIGKKKNDDKDSIVINISYNRNLYPLDNGNDNFLDYIIKADLEIKCIDKKRIKRDIFFIKEYQKHLIYFMQQ